ncbi:MAG: hypothetical protein AAFO07_04605, partial [Bacteroidota bacterium]
MKFSKLLKLKLTLLLTMVCIFLAYGQADLIDDGARHTDSWHGKRYDFYIPSDPFLSYVTFELRGADGGWGKVDDCISGGGNGATVTFDIKIGTEEGEVPPGTLIRFIVGEKGDDYGLRGHDFTGLASGAGGGGTAVLANIDDEWVILGVAGGGGGAYQGMLFSACIDSRPGEGGRAGTSGGDSTGDYSADGGSNGQGGEGGGDKTFDWSDYSGGGGGAFSEGTGNNQLDNDTQELAGKKGLNTGGNGGVSSRTSGGWGFGGGGAGDQGAG